MTEELGADERNVSGRTRGVENDAYQSERAVDRLVDEATEMDPGQK